MHRFLHGERDGAIAVYRFIDERVRQSERSKRSQHGDKELRRARKNENMQIEESGRERDEYRETIA